MDYRPELDGIRGIALFGVLAFHCFFQLWLTGGSWLGVDIFFVLSGYLITAILLNEHARRGSIDLRMFWVRRLLRLYPALLFTLLLSLVFYQVVGDDGTLLGFARTALYAGGYVENFVWGFTGDEHGTLGHTWSLAVEMQFYLIWPPVLIWMMRRKLSLVGWTLGAIVVSYLLLVPMSGSREMTFPFAYAMPWSRAWELLAGALVAIMLARRSPEQVAAAAARAPQRWRGWLILAGIATIYLVAATWNILTQGYVMAWQSPVAVGLTVLLLIHLDRVRNTGVGALLAWKPFAWAGKLSYGVYLIHYPLLQVLRDFGINDPSTEFLVLVPLSFAIAIVSYNLVEKPALRLKGRFTRVRFSSESEQSRQPID